MGEPLSCRYVVRGCALTCIGLACVQLSSLECRFCNYSMQSVYADLPTLLANVISKQNRPAAGARAGSSPRRSLRRPAWLGAALCAVRWRVGGGD